MHRLISTSRPLLSSMASAPPCWWRLELMAASDPPIHRVSRFPHGSRNLASSSGVSEDESGIPNSGSLIPTPEDVKIFLAKYSGMRKNAEDSETTKDSHGCPDSCEDGRRRIMEAIYADTNRRETKGRSGGIVVGDEEENMSCAAEIPRSSVHRVVPLNILPDSSHRDGSIYRDTAKWKKEFCIADRRESLPVRSNLFLDDLQHLQGRCRHTLKTLQFGSFRIFHPVYMTPAVVTWHWVQAASLSVVDSLLCTKSQAKNLWPSVWALQIA